MWKNIQTFYEYLQREPTVYIFCMIIAFNIFWPVLYSISLAFYHVHINVMA